MKKFTKPINRIILIVGLCSLAIYALFFLYDPPINLVGRWNYKSYPIEFEPDGTVHRGGYVGAYEHVDEQLVYIGEWRRESVGSNMVEMPTGLYEFAINVDQLTLTQTVDLEGHFGFSCDAGTAPPIDETAQAVADCLPANASPQEVAELLLRWQRIDNQDWGGVIAANLLPGSEAELILTYHADMTEVIWNPQGKIAVLRPDAGKWRVVFESPDPSRQDSDGRYTLAGNWSFHLAAVGDVTGDGLDDLLVEQQWSNGAHGYESYAKLFTADSAESDSLRVLYLEEGSDTYPNYAIVNQTVQSVIPANGLDAITRTYRLNGNEFTITAETINPKAAQLSATTADGTDWYVYDRMCGTLCAQIFGLYRMQDGQLTHYDVPGRITSLKLLRDGELYLGTTKGIFRMNQERVVDVIAEEYAPIEQQQNIWVPVDMALTGDGDLWVAGQLALLQFGRNQTTVHELIANKVVAAPDDSVWVLGWDGIANSGCCYYHVQEDEIRAYKFADPLPVSGELEQQIRAMRQ